MPEEVTAGVLDCGMARACVLEDAACCAEEPGADSLALPSCSRCACRRCIWLCTTSICCLSTCEDTSSLSGYNVISHGHLIEQATTSELP